MLTITKLKMWKDPGYTRECVEVPPAGSVKLPVPDYSSTASMRPRKSEIMNELQIPVPFLQLKDMSYMYIEVTDGTTPTPNTMKMFGWVLDVSEIASAAEACAIRWTPDWWRTCSGDAVFGKGTVTRCNDATYKRPFGTQPRMWKVKHKELLVPDPNFAIGPSWYVIVPYNETVNGTTVIRTLFWKTKAQTSGESVTTGGITYNSPSLYYVFNGTLDEILGLDPDRIIGIFISPIPPDTPSNVYIITNTDSLGSHWFSHYTYGTSIYTEEHDTVNTYVSNDMYKTVIVDPNGSVVYTLPWGYEINHITNIVDSGTVGCSLDVALKLKTSTETGVDLAATGRLTSIPLNNAPFNTNAFASYNFSGQRSYDKRMREIQRNEQMVAGFTGTGQSMIGGAIAGASKGSVAGAAAGAVAGGITSTIGTTIGYFTQGMFNDEMQKEEDKLRSNQASTIIESAGGWSPFLTDKTGCISWYIVQLEADTVSMAEYGAKITNDGYSVDIPVGSASAFVTAGGPLQVQNMMISGTIPPQAKTYIKNIMANGIRIVENNPSGTDPGV